MYKTPLLPDPLQTRKGGDGVLFFEGGKKMDNVLKGNRV